MGYLPGDRILAQWEGGPLWFPGTVHSLNGNSIAIQYDDGTSEIRPDNQVKPFDWRPGSAIDAVWSGNGQWFAAHILEISRDGRTILVCYDDDNSEEERPTALCRSH